MAIRYARTHVHVEGRGAVEDAMPLAQFLVEHPRAKLSLTKCTGMHGALLQVILAFRPTIASLPADPLLARLLGPTPIASAANPA